MIPMFMLANAVGGAGVVTVSDDTLSFVDGPAIGVMVSGVRFNIDGTVDQITGDTGAGGPDYNQINSATDWVIPNSKNTGYHIKIVKDSGDALNGSGIDPVGSWVALSSDRYWYYERGTTGSYSGTFTISISRDGGTTTIDSGSYTISLNVLA